MDPGEENSPAAPAGDSNPRPFSHESGALTTELSPPRLTVTRRTLACKGTFEDVTLLERIYTLCARLPGHRYCGAYRGAAIQVSRLAVSLVCVTWAGQTLLTPFSLLMF